MECYNPLSNDIKHYHTCFIMIQNVSLCECFIMRIYRMGMLQNGNGWNGNDIMGMFQNENDGMGMLQNGNDNIKNGNDTDSPGA